MVLTEGAGLRNDNYLVRISQTCCGMTIGMGVLTFVGWLSGVRLLASIRPDYIPMAPNTATAFIILGISVLVLTFWSFCRFSRWFSAFSAIFTIVLGILTLIQYFIRVDLNIDQMILKTSGVLGKVPVGCMSPITGGNFLLGGVALLLLALPSYGRLIRDIASCLAVATTITGLVVILGYIYGTPILYGGNTVPMAVTTACAFVCLGIALIMATGSERLPVRLFTGVSTRARLMRVFFPTTIGIILVENFVDAFFILKWNFNPALVIAVYTVVFTPIVGIFVFRMSKTVGDDIDRAETERKQAAENLKKSEEKFRLLAESSQDGILAYDKDIHYTLWNKAMEQISGVTSNEMLGKTPFEIFPFLDEVGEGDAFRETITGKTTKRLEMPYSVPQTGRCGYFESSHFPLYTTNGTIIGGMAIIRDVTERVQTERRLDAEHSITRILAESTTLNEGFPKFLQAICECLGWDLGGIWMIDRKAGVLRCEEIWHIPSLEAKEFTTVTRLITFSPGVGLPGRIWASAKPAWIVNVIHDANFPRAPVAAKAGLHAAFGFPILIGNDVIGIIEFFSHEIKEPDESILNMMSAIGSQIGQFIRRKEAESKIIKLSRAVEQSPNTIVITDGKGNIEYVNPKGIQLTGYTPEEVIGKNPRIFKSGETSPEEYERLWAVITSGGEWRGELRNRKKNGECYWEQTSISSIKDSSGAITNFVAIKEDMSERKRLEAHLNHLANNDPLTNLFNRRRFREELEDWVAQMERHESTGALLFIDLDNFKYINDTLGHQKGDEILINFACLLRARVRETDVLARLGGDEFAIILPFTDAYRAQSIAMQILGLATGNTHAHNGGLPGVTASVGIALFPEHGEDAEKLLAAADIAMYMAKGKGRNCVCVYSPDQKTRIELRMDWEERIRDALKNNRFVLHLQPILNIQHKKIMGYEALLRMVACPRQGSENENDTLISPQDFLNIAERSCLIHEIDRWVVRRAIHLIVEQRFTEKGLFLEVNLSGRAFSDPELLPLIKQEFAAANVNPEALVFEVTETAAIENMVDALRFITTLKGMGCRFGLDDFGIGFSSFSYLKQLPVDFLKIDGSFISELKHNKTDQHLVRAMVEVARGLGKQTVAEFVGCEETVQLLSKYGVDYAQGYHIGKPCDVSEIDTYSGIST